MAPPQLFVGESASYRFTDAESESIDVTIKVIAEEKYWLLLDVNEGNDRYRATVHTGCFDTGTPADYNPPDDPDFFNNPRLLEILRPGTSPLNSHQIHGPSGIDSCRGASSEFVAALGRTLPVHRCELATPNGQPFEGVIAVDLMVISGFGSKPMSGLLSKTVTLENNQTRTIELVGIGDVIADDGRPLPPKFLNSFSYGGNALELTWQQPDDGRAALFEVQRNHEIVAVVDALSYYDDDLTVFENYQYSVTAIDALGMRSVTVNIAPGFYNYGFQGGFTVPERRIPPPQNFFGFIRSGTLVELQWHSATFLDDELFEISRDGVSLGSFSGSNYVDNTVLPGNTYEYTIVSLADNGGRSLPLSTTFTTPQAPGSGPPTESAPRFAVESEVYSSSAAELSWPDIHVGIGRRVEVYQNDILVADTNGSSHFIDNLASGTRYEFELFYYDYDGSLRGRSQLIELTTPGEANTSFNPEIGDSTIAVSGNTISWPDDGWYQVQSTLDYSSVCEGGRSCDVPSGEYVVINHTLQIRTLVAVETNGIDSHADPGLPLDGTPVVQGGEIRWLSSGWYQVQSQTDFRSVCEGGFSCSVPPGSYIVINHSTGQRWENIMVVDGVITETSVPVNIDSDRDGTPDNIDVDQTGGIDRDFDGIDDAFQFPQNDPHGDEDGDGIANFRDVDTTGGLDENFDGIDDLFQIIAIDDEADEPFEQCEGTSGSDSESVNDDWGDNCFLQTGNVHAESSYTRGVQRILNCLGYPVTDDAIFGPATEAAVIAFQSDNPPLTINGIVGAETWRALRNTLETRSFDQNLDSASVAFYDPDGDGVDSSICIGVILFYQSVEGSILGGWEMTVSPGNLNRVPFSIEF